MIYSENPSNWPPLSLAELRYKVAVIARTAMSYNSNANKSTLRPNCGIIYFSVVLLTIYRVRVPAYTATSSDCDYCNAMVNNAAELLYC